MRTHRDLFSLPPLALSASMELAVPDMPAQKVATGDKEVDAVLWLREVIATGNPGLIDKAMQAAKLIKTPMDALEKRYRDFLQRTNPGNLFAALSSFGFGELDELAKRSVLKIARQQEARSRFGGDAAIWADTPAEAFCIKALKGLKRKPSGWDFEDAQVDQRFNLQSEMVPKTLKDCLRELNYWDDLYELRNSFDHCGDGHMEMHARKWFVMRCMGRIRPASSEEALKVFKHLEASGQMGMIEARAILLNLIKGPALVDVAA